MKKLLFVWLLMMAVALGACASAEMVSIAELHDQAEALGGRWQKTFSTKNGEVVIDAPILVPDVETMPVLTMEGAKVSEELYEQIIQGEWHKDSGKNAIAYEIEMDGEMIQFFLGHEENGLEGYAAANSLWMKHGKYREDLKGYAAPTSYLYSWELDPQAACLRGTDMTLNKAMSLWRKDIELCFPGETFEIEPTSIVARGSTLTDETGKTVEYSRDGYFMISAHQLIGDVPLLGGIVDQYGYTSYAYRDDRELRELGMHAAAKKRNAFGVGVSSVGCDGMESRFATDEDYFTITSLARTRSVEIADVPLASLDSLLTNLSEQVEKGKIGGIGWIKLGYILYLNPEMTDHAWAIPRWVVKYITPKDAVRDPGNDPYGFPESLSGYYQYVLGDAQSGETLFFGVGDKDTFSVPKMATWDDVN